MKADLLLNDLNTPGIDDLSTPRGNSTEDAEELLCEMFGSEEVKPHYLRCSDGVYRKFEFDREE